MVGRSGYKVLAFFFLGLGVAGIVLPLLPTTPFVLLAAACFARSSIQWHQWLLNSATFGPLIRDWQDRRSISPRTKFVALSSIVIFGGYSLVFGLENIYLRIICGLLLAYGFIFVARIQVAASRSESVDCSGQ